MPRRVGQQPVEVGVQPYVVGHVREEGPSGSYACGKPHGFFEVLMGGVWLLAQGIDDQHLHPVEQAERLVGQGEHVGDVGQPSSYAVPQDGQTTVHDAEGQHLRPPYVEGGAGVNLGQPDAGDARIGVLDEAVGHTCPQVVGGVVLGVDGYLAEAAEGAQVVQPSHVVVVFVGDEHAVYGAKPVAPQHLFAEVGSAVYQDVLALVREDQCGGAQAVVARVGRGAHRTGAAHFGDTRGGAAS